MNKKLMLGGLAGGLIFFLLGFVIYGVLLSSYMTAHTNQCLALPEADLKLGVLFISNILTSFLITLFIQHSTSVTGALGKGALFGVLYAAGVNLNNYSMTSMYPEMMVLWVDLAAFAVLTALTSLSIFLVMQKVN